MPPGRICSLLGKYETLYLVLGQIGLTLIGGDFNGILSPPLLPICETNVSCSLWVTYFAYHYH